jgi:hypothetical protein
MVRRIKQPRAAFVSAKSARRIRGARASSCIERENFRVTIARGKAARRQAQRRARRKPDFEKLRPQFFL